MKKETTLPSKAANEQAQLEIDVVSRQLHTLFPHLGLIVSGEYHCCEVGLLEYFLQRFQVVGAKIEDALVPHQHI
jgi:hypothetical protein